MVSYMIRVPSLMANDPNRETGYQRQVYGMSLQVVTKNR